MTGASTVADGGKVAGIAAAVCAAGIGAGEWLAAGVTDAATVAEEGEFESVGSTIDTAVGADKGSGTETGGAEVEIVGAGITADAAGGVAAGGGSTIEIGNAAGAVIVVEEPLAVSGTTGSGTTIICGAGATGGLLMFGFSQTAGLM